MILIGKEDNIASAVMSTWIPFYHDKDLVHGKVCNDRYIAKYSKLGIGCETRCVAIREVSGKLDFILTIVGDITDNGKCKKYTKKVVTFTKCLGNKIMVSL